MLDHELAYTKLLQNFRISLVLIFLCFVDKEINLIQTLSTKKWYMDLSWPFEIGCFCGVTAQFELLEHKLLN